MTLNSVDFLSFSFSFFLSGGAAAVKRATCLLRSGSANVGTEGPTHHAAVQNAPPQDPVLPVEVGSTS